MGLVLYALKFRITTYVLAVLMMLGGLGAIIVTPKDVLPVVNIPVVVVVWTYTGLSTPEMEQRVTTYAEFGISNNVNNIRRMESTTLQGTAVQRIYFDPSVSIDLAIAQVVSSTNSIRAAMPPRHPAAGDRALLGLVRAGDPARPVLGPAEPARRSGRDRP